MEPRADIKNLNIVAPSEVDNLDRVRLYNHERDEDYGVELGTLGVALGVSQANLALTLGKHGRNLCLQSEALGTGPWTLDRATVTSDAAVAPDGTTTADLLTRTSALDSSVYQNIAYTGNGTKALSVFVKQGTAPAPGFMVYDTTTSATLVDVAMTWTGGVPVLSKQGGSGTMFTAIPVGNGWFRVAFTVDSIVAANTNRLLCFASYIGGANGQTVYLWGAQVENASTLSAYVKTTTVPVGAETDSAGKTLFPAGLGVGNAAAASTIPVSGLVKKIEIFDAAGASLGFAPLYSSIT